jgi:hypothetical protein
MTVLAPARSPSARDTIALSSMRLRFAGARESALS